MLTLTGDILNWLTAGILFPVLFLPIAALINAALTSGSTKTPRAAPTNAPSGQRPAAGVAVTGTMIWIVMVVALIMAIVAFGAAAPRLWAPPAAAELRSSTMTEGFLLLILTMIVIRLGGPAAVCAILARPLTMIIQTFGQIVHWFIVSMAIIQFSVVILRYVFGVNFIFMQESVTYLHGGVFLLAGGYALLTNDHVRVDIFYSQASARRRAIIDLAGSYLFLFPFCLTILWAAGPYVANAWAVREGSAEQSGIQGIFLLKSLIPIFALLLIMAGFVQATRAAFDLMPDKTRLPDLSPAPKLNDADVAIGAAPDGVRHEVRL